MFFFVMKGISVLLFLLVLISCKSAISDQEVFLFNDISFNLRNNEKIVGLDKKNVAIFDSCFLNRKIQLPLFKCIKNDDYSLYLALPLDASIKELSEIEMHEALHKKKVALQQKMLNDEISRRVNASINADNSRSHNYSKFYK